MIKIYNVKSYCSEDISLIENYEEAIKSDTHYDCHHRLEIQNGIIKSAKQLEEEGLYWNRPASELIFLTHSEHISLHMSYRKGEKNPTYGKHLSLEHRQKTSESIKLWWQKRKSSISKTTD